jgi:phage shock protein E
MRNIFSAIIMFFSSFGSTQALNKVSVSSKEASALLLKETAIVVLDVRTSDEFKQGHLKGAVNIDILKSNATTKLDSLNHETTYLVYCRSGHSSGMAVKQMVKSKFKMVYEMKDGFMGWTGNKLPVVK